MAEEEGNYVEQEFMGINTRIRSLDPNW